MLLNGSFWKWGGVVSINNLQVIIVLIREGNLDMDGRVGTHVKTQGGEDGHLQVKGRSLRRDQPANTLNLKF